MFMYFFIAMVCASIGMILVLRGTPVKQSLRNKALIDTDIWIENIYTSFQKILKSLLKFIVVHLVQWYRHITQNMTIHRTIKQRIRELLYEHYREKKEQASLQKSSDLLKIKRD